jgi:hypothetical protein
MSNCYERLQKFAEARGMLEQAKAIVKQLPAGTGQPNTSTTNMTPQEWEAWLQWASQFRQQTLTEELARTSS